MHMLLFHLLHLCYAELVCFRAIPETRKVAAAVVYQKWNPETRFTI
jgi:hypothetical protein